MRRRVIDAVSNHRYPLAASLEHRHNTVFVLRENLRKNLVNPQVIGHGFSHRARIPGNHHDAHAMVLKGGDGFGGFRTDLILERKAADDLPIANDMENSRPPIHPSGRLLL